MNESGTQHGRGDYAQSKMEAVAFVDHGAVLSGFEA